MRLTADTTVARVAVSHPASLRVFHRRDIDFCCGGGRTLADACRSKGLDAEALIAEILVAANEGAADATDWSQRPRAELIDHIVQRYHEPLREDLPRLVAMAQKVLQVHGARDPVRLGLLEALVRDIADELLPHMQKEEAVLFPWLRAGHLARVAMPIEVMRREHEVAGAQLAELRRLTDDYAVPPGACATWRGLWQGLETLDRELREHIHLENNVLFVS